MIIFQYSLTKFYSSFLFSISQFLKRLSITFHLKIQYRARMCGLCPMTNELKNKMNLPIYFLFSKSNCLVFLHLKGESLGQVCFEDKSEHVGKWGFARNSLFDV